MRRNSLGHRIVAFFVLLLWTATVTGAPAAYDSRFTVRNSANNKWEFLDLTDPGADRYLKWNNSTNRPEWVEGDLGVTGAHPSDEVDTPLAGLTANDSTKKIFSTQNHVTPTYVRSATCWGADLDLTCVSPWNDEGEELWAGTAITPRHVIFAHHVHPANGATIRFITADGTVVSRTISNSMQVGATDIRVALLSSDLPATITPAKLLPDDWSRWLTAAGTAVAYMDQEEKLLVADIVGLSDTTLTIEEPTDAQRATFYEAAIAGDSGNPIMMFVRGETVLVACFQTDTAGPSLINDNRAAVLAAITTLGAFGHAPEDVTFPSAIDAAAVRNPAGFSLPGSVITSGTVAAARLGSGVVGAGELVLHDDGVFRAVSGAGLGDVSASANFGTDNRIITSDGTNKNVQSTAWSISADSNMTGAASTGTVFYIEGTDADGIYSASDKTNGYAIFGDAIGTGTVGVLGAASVAGGVGVVAESLDAGAPSLAIKNVGGFSANIFNAGTANRTWHIPDDTASPNLFASRGWVGTNHAALAGSNTIAGTNTFSGTVLNLGGGASAMELRFLEPSGGGTSYFSLKAPALAGNVGLTLPNSAPTAGQVLGDSDADGVLEWINPAGGGDVTQAGNNVFTGDNDFSASTVTLGDVAMGNLTASGLTLGATAITATGTEINYTDGVTSSIQTQLDSKAATTAIDTVAEVETLWGGVNILLETEIDASAELRALMDDESGTGALLFAGGDIGAGTATTAALGDNDTSVATTAFVQQERAIVTKNTNTSYTIGTTDARELYGGVIYVTGAATITIPAVAAGASFTVITIGAVAVSVDPNASDLIYLNGTALADGDKITNTSTTGDMAVFTYYDATGWVAMTNTGWTDTN